MVKPAVPQSPAWNPAKLPDRLAGFVATWRAFQGTEQSGARSFLRDLLDVYEVESVPGTIFEQHPVRIPARGTRAAQGALFPGEDTGSRYTTERMDMYLPRVCVWEMKSPTETDLQKHHAQLLRYWAHSRPRYMVLCNFREFWIYDTNEADGQLVPAVTFKLAELPRRGDALLFLRGDAPDLAPRAVQVTAEVARYLGLLLRNLVEASPHPERDRERTAKFILECVFAMFAEDSELIPPQQFTTAVREADRTGRMEPIWSLFDDFSRDDPRDKGNPFAPYVNGSLFDRKQPKFALTPEQIHDLYGAAKNFDWLDVRPEIFGSIFEQALGAVDRHALGAHFTHERDILRVLNATIVEPWRARLLAIRTPRDAQEAIDDMRAFHVLDPACGCGNFLYVAYREMKRLEAAAAARWTEFQRHFAERVKDVKPPPPRPYFTLAQVHGIEVNAFAASLARVVLWIGEHLAKRELGLDEETLPLKNLDANVVEGDALTAAWPRPDGELAIVGNPPYLGVRKMRQELGDDYVEALAARFPANRAADFVTHWFTRALDVLRPGERAGYVCTNSIAQNESREASIDAILAKDGALTDAWKSYAWPGEAAVHVAIVNWVMAPYEGVLRLDGKEVDRISPTLTGGSDVTVARTLEGNRGLCFMGVTPGNHEFVLTAQARDAILAADPTSDKVIKPFLIGRDVNREVDQKPTRWIIDFGVMEKEDAEGYTGAMRHVRKHVYPAKYATSERKTEGEQSRWWQLVRPRSEMRAAIKGLKRVLVVPSVAPHLIVSRQAGTTCFDHQLMVMALSGDYHLGILQSRIHEIWARARGSTLEERLRYTNTTCFETFPFPYLARKKYAPAEVPTASAAKLVEATAAAFDDLRSRVCKERDTGLTKVHNLLAGAKLPELTAAYDAMNDAVNACYGFPAGTWRDEQATLRELLGRNQEIAAAE